MDSIFWIRQFRLISISEGTRESLTIEVQWNLTRNQLLEAKIRYYFF